MVQCSPAYRLRAGAPLATCSLRRRAIHSDARRLGLGLRACVRRRCSGTVRVLRLVQVTMTWIVAVASCSIAVIVRARGRQQGATVESECERTPGDCGYFRRLPL